MKNQKKLFGQLFFLLLLIVGTFFILRNSKREASIYQMDQGTVFGTLYHITYQYPTSLKNEFEAELKKVDGSLSMFNDSSIISKINRNEDVMPDSLFLHVFRLAHQISDHTNGAFDITVAPLVNVWGFGFKHSQNVDKMKIDSISRFVGYQKVSLDKNNHVVKTDPRVMIDCSAIAKGFGCDVVARFFDKMRISNYMVEIGGEVVVRGVNSYQSKWHIGINKPVDDSLSIREDLETVLNISNVGMATSGNYRNFYYKDGKKYAHTIDPRQGYPVQHNLLSSTVIASDCATADAYATSFMVMGVDSAMALCHRTEGLDGYFIYEDEDGQMKTVFTDGLKAYMKP